MKQIIIIIVLVFFSGFSSNAQITLAQSFGPANAQSEIVNLSLSGKKIMVVSPISGSLSSTAIDTVNFYNLDYSFWKGIICPYIPGYQMDAGPSGGTNLVTVYYPSETLFNTDALLEIAVCYINSTTGVGKILIFNETNTIVDSMTNVVYGNSIFNLYGRAMRVYDVDTLGIGWQAVVRTPTGVAIYNLPGSLPCPTCSGNGAGLATNEKNKCKIETQPIPNPSANEVKITFKLPVGTNQGNLVLYNTEGRKIESFVVDNRFGFILLDNSKLAPGVYYYNIEVNGEVSSTQKMVVIK